MTQVSALQGQLSEADALQARAAGAHERAIVAWRAALRLRPDDWRLGLELKHDLKAGLHYPDSDPQFRRAARGLPDAEWLAHYAALYQFHGSDLDFLDSRARRMLRDAPQDHRLLSIIGEAATQRRDWPGAEQAFAAAFTAQPDRGDYAARRDEARMYQRLAPALRAGTGRPYSVAVVNLDRNAERMEELHRQFAGCAPPIQRVPGIEGSRLPEAAVRRLDGDPTMRGTLGCFLSHAAAWEAMLARPEPVCLVVEDDVIPLLDLPPSLDSVVPPDGFDLCFVNDRIAPARDASWVDGFLVHSLEAALHQFHPDDNAPGGDGYLLTKAGAAKLLDWVGQDGFHGDVDWRLLAYGLTPQQIATLPRPSHATSVLDALRHKPRRAERLRAQVLHPPLIRTVGVSSDREDQNRLHPG